MRKLGRPTDQRIALLKNQVSNLLWNGKIETTLEKAKDVRSLAEKYITLAMRTYKDTVKVEKTVATINAKGDRIKETKEVINDGPKKLAARRKLMANLNDLQEIKGEKESKTAYKDRTKVVAHPLIEKLFNELAPKYDARKEELGQGGGYTRIYKLGFRHGDNAEMAILELI